ncbi:uncharacterized protein LOC104433145 isoform X3 [Eucalyptus grandis]|uniref:uncharacterized protein LOC104433145 isoform X2 n=1 Tax=Eucalyptus grandis TaxID=71139 RepID=UPI00192EF986|nr:uncharacterized protein LOC104433145 isoform X2 [Eucalyptus grandis]XP_039166949.1 uncharacterized protein LOC104433145 isoform X3 [Eucalyptus grandis]
MEAEEAEEAPPVAASRRRRCPPKPEPPPLLHGRPRISALSPSSGSNRTDQQEQKQRSALLEGAAVAPHATSPFPARVASPFAVPCSACLGLSLAQPSVSAKFQIWWSSAGAVHPSSGHREASPWFGSAPPSISDPTQLRIRPHSPLTSRAQRVQEMGFQLVRARFGSFPGPEPEAHFGNNRFSRCRRRIDPICARFGALT